MTKSKEEAIASGVKVSETKHHMKRRSPWHNYYKKGTYMLTLVVEGRKPLLGKLRVPGEEPLGMVAQPPGIGAIEAKVELTALGKAILEEEFRKITKHYRMVELWKACIMPDHIHMIVRVAEDMPKGKHLGQVVWGFKVGCTQALWRINGLGEEPPGTETKAPGTEAKAPGMEAQAPGTEAKAPGMEAKVRGMEAKAPGTEAKAPGMEAKAPGTEAATVPADSSAGEKRSLFEPGYNDKILFRDGQLENWKHYLDDNPRRLAIKRLYPDYFTVIHQAEVVGRSCQMVGNRFLLDIPQKMAVIVHSGFTDNEYADWRRKWLACGEAGGVLVSASIATREKMVMREAMNRGYNIILLRENGFPPLYKPSGESFDACSGGRLLQISPWEYHMERKTISREQCLMLNRMAEDIAECNSSG